MSGEISRSEATHVLASAGIPQVLSTIRVGGSVKEGGGDSGVLPLW